MTWDGQGHFPARSSDPWANLHNSRSLTVPSCALLFGDNLLAASRLETPVKMKNFSVAMIFVVGSLLVLPPLVAHANATRGTHLTASSSLSPRATSTLRVSSTIRLPINASTVTTATEAPNGTVFFARQSTTTPVASVVWVVDGTSAPAVAEHLAHGASALAADDNYLYVATYKNVTAYSRKTGTKVREWALPSFSTANTSDNDVVSLTAFRGTVLVMLPRGKDEAAYELHATSAKTPRLVAQGPSMVVGSDGTLVFERSDHRLVKRSNAGAVTVGPKLSHKPTPLGGGVQYVDAVAGGFVWVSEPAGQGLDTSFAIYRESSLKFVAGSHQGLVNEQIVSTSTGALVLGDGESMVKCPQTSKLSNVCVYRISSKAVLSDATPVGSAFLLVGPQPAVFTTIGTSNYLFLDRLDT